jgi:hypothetical protein
MSGQPNPDSVDLAEQKVLGQRRPIVGQLALVTDRHDARVVTLPTLRLDGAQSGQGGTDNNDVTGTHQVNRPSAMRRTRRENVRVVLVIA